MHEDQLCLQQLSLVLRLSSVLYSLSSFRFHLIKPDHKGPLPPYSPSPPPSTGCQIHLVYVFSLVAPKLAIVEFANIVDPDEATHSEPPHLDLRCLSVIP